MDVQELFYIRLRRFQIWNIFGKMAQSEIDNFIVKFKNVMFIIIILDEEKDRHGNVVVKKELQPERLQLKQWMMNPKL